MIDYVIPDNTVLYNELEIINIISKMRTDLRINAEIHHNVG